MLTRDSLRSGAFLDQFADLPTDLRWSLDRIDASLQSTLARRPAGWPVRLFAYGSLIWNPAIDYVHEEVAILDGWHRRFSLQVITGRGSLESPGRMLSIQRGGRTGGVAFALDDARSESELRLVWMREMLTGAYRPQWAPVKLADGQRVPCIVFAENRDHPFWRPDSSVATVAPLAAAASGPYGTNADYVFQLAASLRRLGIRDAHVEALEAAIRQQPGHASCAEMR